LISSPRAGRKQPIRRSLREFDREKFIKLGKEFARVAFENVNKKATDRALKTAAKHYGLPSADELLARLGSSEIAARDVVAELYPNLKVRDTDEVGPAVALMGLEPGQKFTHGVCCNPLPWRAYCWDHFQRSWGCDSHHRLPQPVAL
jgi:(p)ppGpp synthase/HD superfamily hydrolase